MSVEGWLRNRRKVARLRGQGAPFPVLAPTGGDRERVFIGPANSAGQAYRWARALEQARPRTAATSMVFQGGPSPFAYPIDQTVQREYAMHSLRWMRSQRKALSRQSAVIIESALSLLSGHRGPGTAQQALALREAGVACALLFHGSDIRDPDTHLAAEPYSHFGVDADFCAKMREVTARSREVIALANLPVFVSTPDLLSEVEGARWLPVVIDTEAWSTPEPPLGHGGPPRVVHVPSNSFVKGTELVEGTLRTMHEAGTIEYRQVSGVPHSEIATLYRRADIVIDQFRVGNYGVAACEALAAGRVVVSHVSEDVRRRTRELTGQELPVVEATPEDLEAVLLNIAENSDAARGVAKLGPGFVRDTHDGRRSGEVLASWMNGDAGDWAAAGTREDAE